MTRNHKVTIPEDVRDKLKINDGDFVEVEALGSGRIILNKIIPEEELAGAWDEEMDEVMKEVGKIWKSFA